MAMRYDPIMCMMVPDTVKAKDANPVVGKTYEIMGKKFKVVKVEGSNVTVIGENGIVSHFRLDMFNSAKVLDNKAIDKAITTCDKIEFDPQDLQYIRRAIGTLKNANSLLGMINEGTVNKAKQNIANTISLLESID